MSNLCTNSYFIDSLSKTKTILTYFHSNPSSLQAGKKLLISQGYKFMNKYKKDQN